jgi:hypothetical protein
VAISIYIPELEANEINDAQPARTETVYIGARGSDWEGHIRVRTENLASGTWNTYYYLGTSLL